MKLFKIGNLFFILLFVTLSAHAEIVLQTFEKQTYQSILENENQQSFLLVLWSLDCPPCMDELSMLGGLHQQFPDKKIILVSTDSEAQSDEIMQIMNKFKLTGLPQWVFGNESPQYLRYSIDPLWYGELPRSYFHTAETRQAVSGKLKKADLIRWFNAG